jgi:5-methylcytosine-specific restriction enzyme subunit McrC
VEYDEYLPDIEVNRILKSALVKLNKISKNMKNQKHLRELLFIFDNVSKYKRKDFKYVLNRNLSYYKNALLWAEVFLKNRSFSVFRGENKAFALLFDMNKLFENYVGDFFKRRCKNVKLQDKKFKLFENEEKFALIPDIVINKKIIFDTKWKIINEKSDISQADLYQMYAYVTKYKIKRGYLLYPFTKNRTVYEFVTEICNGEEAKIKIIFFDLKKEKIIAF